MFYGLAHKLIEMEGLQFEHILRDIETLNQWALEGRLEVTAISVHNFAYVHDKYALLPNGASMGERYGPIVVARERLPLEALAASTIAVPGERTTAFLALKLCLGDFDYRVVPFDQIMDCVQREEVDAGLIIHEGQLTYASHGLRKVLDLGEWWHNETGLPLPLGCNVVRKDLGEEMMSRIAAVLERSIRYGLAHREEALAYALQWAHDMDMSAADRFVEMYVNERTLNYGQVGREAVEMLLQRGYAAGHLPAPIKVEFVKATPGD
jgi:1,4-dihydroxy-6-naphthoate synthase